MPFSNRLLSCGRLKYEISTFRFALFLREFNTLPNAAQKEMPFSVTQFSGGFLIRFASDIVSR